MIKEGDNLAELIVKAVNEQKSPIQENDVLVVTHVAVSKAEGALVDLDRVSPSRRAKQIAEETGKDPRLVEVILQETKEIVRMDSNHFITETKHGIVCANAGVDKSNVGKESKVALLPKDPDESAQNIRKEIERLTGFNVATIITDTHGRPLRTGQINVAIGVSGVRSLRNRCGEKDLFGYVLRVKQNALADELAAASGLVMGHGNEGIPAVIIRGYDYLSIEDTSAIELIRPKEKDLFR